MVKLKNITKDNGFVHFAAYVEDCKMPVSVTVNIKTKQADFELPIGYEWCDWHIFKASKYVLSNLGDLPENHTIMWY